MSSFGNPVAATSILTDKGIVYMKIFLILFFLLSDVKDHIPSGAHYN